MSVVTKSCGAENTFSDALRLVDCDFTLSLYGTFSATVVLQRKLSIDSATEYRDVESYTVATEKNGVAIGAWDYRLGIKTGGYSSGTAKVALANKATT